MENTELTAYVLHLEARHTALRELFVHFMGWIAESVGLDAERFAVATEGTLEAIMLDAPSDPRQPMFHPLRRFPEAQRVFDRDMAEEMFRLLARLRRAA